MATEDAFEQITGQLGQVLIEGLTGEVHDTLKEVLYATSRWLHMGAPTVHPSHTPRSHPATIVSGLPNEILLLCFAECASIYGDANRRLRDGPPVGRKRAASERELCGEASTVMETELIQRLEKR